MDSMGVKWESPTGKGLVHACTLLCLPLVIILMFCLIDLQELAVATPQSTQQKTSKDKERYRLLMLFSTFYFCSYIVAYNWPQSQRVVSLEPLHPGILSQVQLRVHLVQPLQHPVPVAAPKVFQAWCSLMFIEFLLWFYQEGQELHAPSRRILKTSQTESFIIEGRSQSIRNVFLHLCACVSQKLLADDHL